VSARWSSLKKAERLLLCLRFLLLRVSSHPKREEHVILNVCCFFALLLRAHFVDAFGFAGKPRTIFSMNKIVFHFKLCPLVPLSFYPLRFHTHIISFNLTPHSFGNSTECCPTSQPVHRFHVYPAVG
jgi:hypothetical protein